MYETRFELKQHTPLIHFLHDQPDATLRATELKPKLDTFIAARMDTIPEHWIAKEQEGHKALDYKVSIQPSGNKAHKLALSEKQKEVWDEVQMERKLKWVTEPAYPHLLANVGGKEYRDELKNLIFFEGATIRVHCWHKDLIEEIERRLPLLLETTNFGNRPSKGFGSFSCVRIKNEITEWEPAAIPELGYYFEWEAADGSFKDLFEAINVFYKCIRSGINEVEHIQKDDKGRALKTKTRFYFKSLMYAYAKEKKSEDWDKNILKRHFYNNMPLAANVKNDYRDWLGLSTDESWAKNGTLTKKFAVKKESQTEAVQRFPSPILFKPKRIGDSDRFRIYFGGYIDKTIKDTYSGAKIKVNMAKHHAPPLVLTPSSKFDLAEFLNFVFEFRDKNRRESHLKIYDRDHINSIDYWLYDEKIAPIFDSLTQNTQPSHAG